MLGDELFQKITKEYERVRQEVKKPNILILGGTGVGKSSIVNLCFGSECAPVGTGVPQTQVINRYAADNVPVVIFDTKGYEIGTDSEQEFLDHVVSYMASAQGEHSEHDIHLAWYCIQAAGHRVTEADQKYIRLLAATGKPVAVLLTKCDVVTQEEVDALTAELGKLGAGIPSFLLTTKALGELGYLDLEKLLAWSHDSLSHGLRLAFLSAQKRNLTLKRKEANLMVAQHAASAAVVGISPIPFSDAPLLVANQAGMIARILYVYDLQSIASQLSGIVSTMGGGALVSSFGAMVAGSLLKLIPGVGTAVGGVINGTVASTITGAMGMAVSEICYRVSAAMLEGDPAKLQNILADFDGIFERMFKEFFQLTAGKR